MTPGSKGTLLRTARRRGSPSFVSPSVLGIDDWARRRNRRYGTLICDLKRRRTIALLSDREPATAQAWLSAQPEVAQVACDRVGRYALAAAKALPDAVPVADRWHLMENASRAFLETVRESMRQVRAAIGAATINPSLLTAAEQIQYERYLRREKDNTAVLGPSQRPSLNDDGMGVGGHGRMWFQQVVETELDERTHVDRNHPRAAYARRAPFCQ